MHILNTLTAPIVLMMHLQSSVYGDNIPTKYHHTAIPPFDVRLSDEIHFRWTTQSVDIFRNVGITSTNVIRPDENYFSDETEPKTHPIISTLNAFGTTCTIKNDLSSIACDGRFGLNDITTRKHHHFVYEVNLLRVDAMLNQLDENESYIYVVHATGVHPHTVPYQMMAAIPDDCGNEESAIESHEAIIKPTNSLYTTSNVYKTHRPDEVIRQTNGHTPNVNELFGILPWIGTITLIYYLYSHPLGSLPFAVYFFVMLLDVSHGQRYHVVTDQGGVNWATANEYCETHYGTQLATIYSTEDAQQLLDLKLNSTAPDNPFWVGLRLNGDIDTGIWQWVDDIEYSCQNDTSGCEYEMYWVDGQPDYVTTGEGCAATWPSLYDNAVLSVDGMLNDFQCELTHFYGSFHFICDGIGDGGCSNKSNERPVLSNRIYACPGTIESGGVYGQSAQQLCADDYHVCDSASETSALGLTSTECQSIAQSWTEFFATKESHQGWGRCTSLYPHNFGFNAIWGCARDGGKFDVGYDIYDCSPLSFWIHKLMGSPPAYWDMTQSTEYSEASTIALTDEAGGGVLCCAGSDSQYTPYPDIYQCVNSGEVTAHYHGHSVNSISKLWIDISGNDHTVDLSLNMASLSRDQSLNGYGVLSGDTTASITFPFNLMPTHTVINLCKYNGEAQGRILQTTIHNGIFGFHGGNAGIAYEDGWITDYNNIDTEWLLSSQTPSMYRGNGVNYTIGSGSFSGNSSLAINDGAIGDETSDWACAEILVFNRILELNQIKCLENSLTKKYNLPFPSVGTSNPTIAPSVSTYAPSASTYAPSHSPSSPTSNRTTETPSYAPNSTHTPSTTHEPDDPCRTIDLNISNYKGVSSFEFKSTKLQQGITNITNNAIHEVVVAAQDVKLIEFDDESYYVVYVDASTSAHAIQIELDLCAWRKLILDVISDFVKNQSIPIAKQIKLELNKLGFGNADMNVTISLRESTKDQINVSSLWITGGIALLFLAITVIAWCDEKRRRNDFFSFENILLTGVDVCDTVLDCLFAWSLTSHFNETQEWPGQFGVAMIAAWFFIVVPIVLHMVILFMESRQWSQANDELRAWWTDNFNLFVVYSFSVITGSSYAAVTLLNCNAFQWEWCSMGLNQQQQIQFNTKRLTGVIFENLPQLIIQIWYLWTFGFDSLTPVMCIIFTVVSNVVTVSALCTRGAQFRDHTFPKISFDISCDDMKARAPLPTTINGIKQEIALLLGINPKLIDIPKARRSVAHGLKLDIYLLINNIDKKKPDYKTVIRDAARDGRLITIIREEWNLTDQASISISNLDFEGIASPTHISELAVLKSDDLSTNGEGLISIEVDGLQHDNKYS